MAHTSISLASAGAELVGRLGGRWHDGQGLCRCPAHDDRTPSLSVRVGERALLFKCFAGCATADVIHAIRQLDIPVPARRRDESIDRQPWQSRRSSGLAECLWHAAVRIERTPGASYLRGRGLQTLSEALRYNPRTPLGRGRDLAFRPAIIAAVREGQGLTSVHRTFLDPTTATKAADLDNPRRMLGRPRHGAVQLARPNRVLGLAEGIETALAAIQIHRIPVWATLGAERAGQILLPDRIERLVLLFDNDPAGWLAEQRARAAYRRPGLSIITRWPANDDWADLVAPNGKQARIA